MLAKCYCYKAHNAPAYRGRPVSENNRRPLDIVSIIAWLLYNYHRIEQTKKRTVDRFSEIECLTEMNCAAK